jgi:hypothetical protein
MLIVENLNRKRKMKKRKAYKPKIVVQNPLNFFFGGLKRVDANELTELNVKNHMSMANICTGVGTKNDFDRLAGLVNMALVMAEMYFESQYHDTLIKARDSLHSMGMRYREKDIFVFTGDERNAMNEVFDIHEAQLEAVRVIDVERAYQEIERRLRNNINVKPIAKLDESGK